jgi:hypothetical protein
MDQQLPSYWTYFDLEQARGARDFRDLGQIALRVLRRMSENGPVIQVCGPITTGGLGSLSQNLARFQTAVEILKADDYNVFDQMPFQSFMIKLVDAGLSGRDLLEDFYGPIFASGLVQFLFFLPLWETSAGAKWERQRAFLYRLPFADYPNDLLTMAESAKALFQTSFSERGSDVQIQNSITAGRFSAGARVGS